MTAKIRTRRRAMFEKLGKAQSRFAATTEILGRGLRGEAANEVGAAPGQLFVAPDPLAEHEADVALLAEPGPLEALDHVRAVCVLLRGRREIAGREIRVVHEEAPDEIVLVADPGRRHAIGGEQQSRVLDAAAGEDVGFARTWSTCPFRVRATIASTARRSGTGWICTALALRRTSILSACSSSCLYARPKSRG